MTRSILIRILTALLVLWLVSLLIFTATQVLPGDAAQAILGRDATPERLAALRRQLNLEQGLVQQYLGWLGGMLSLDPGNSLANGRPVVEMIGPRIFNSMVLVVLAACVAIPLSLLVGTVAAVRRDGVFDAGSSLATLVIAALPEFVLAMSLTLLLSTGLLNLLPATSVQTPILSAPSQLVLPVTTLALTISPYMIRMARASIIEVLNSDFIQHARLSGVSEQRVVLRYGIPNILAELVQVVALQLAYLAGGVVVVEYVFAFPGLGTALVDAVSSRDLPVIQAICLFIATFYIVVNLVADGVSALVNPRARARGA